MRWGGEPTLISGEIRRRSEGLGNFSRVTVSLESWQSFKFTVSDGEAGICEEPALYFCSVARK